ncbi:MAG: hypothetical protein U5N53_02995 [Mycobacterium sp.]|nr:hypothetical protein [Mycobacterium sp.]
MRKFTLAAGEPLGRIPLRLSRRTRARGGVDTDGDGSLELVSVTTSDLEENDQVDILIAVHSDGSVVNGFPPNTTGAAGSNT